MTAVTIPKKLTKVDELIVVEKKDFEKLEKENIELKSAMKAIVAGELALRQKRTRGLKDFLPIFPKSPSADGRLAEKLSTTYICLADCVLN